jgi:hypothetical protein
MVDFLENDLDAELLLLYPVIGELAAVKILVAEEGEFTSGMLTGD